MSSFYIVYGLRPIDVVHRVSRQTAEEHNVRQLQTAFHSLSSCVSILHIHCRYLAFKLKSIPDPRNHIVIDMAAYIVTGTSIPFNHFSCPSNSSGPEYASIPWSNLSASVFETSTRASYSNRYNGYVGIKGPHPRMAYCCQNAATSEANQNPERQIALAGDHCTQYCSAFVDLDLWLYCLTQNGDLVSNAFASLDYQGDTNQSSVGERYIQTSGSLPRSGPFDEGALMIKDYQQISSATFVTRSTTLLCALFGLSVAAAWLNGPLV